MTAEKTTCESRPSLITAVQNPTEVKDVDAHRRTFVRRLGAGGVGVSVLGLSGCVTTAIKGSGAALLDTFTGSLGLDPITDQTGVNPYTDRLQSDAMRQRSRALFDAAEQGRLQEGARIEALSKARQAMTLETDRVIAALESGAMQSIDEVLLNLSPVFARSLRALESGARPVKSRAPVFRGHSIEVPPWTSVRYGQHGYCMDPDKPAPHSGDSLELWNISARLPARLRPLFKALGVWTAKSPANQAQGQRLTWAIMGAGIESGWASTIGADSLALFDEIYPDGGKVFADYHNGQVATQRLIKLVARKTHLDRYLENIDLRNITSVNAAANAAAQDLIRQGAGMRGDGQPGYTMLSDGVAARSAGSGALAAQVTILNATDQMYVFDTTEWFNQPIARKQGISPTGQITYLDHLDMAYGARAPSPELLSEKQKMYTAIINDLSKIGLVKSMGWLGHQGPGASRALRKISNTVAAQLAARAASSGLKVIPVLGNLLSAYEAVVGRDWLTNEPLTPVDRMLATVGIVPGANMLTAIARTARISGVTRLVSNLADKQIFKLVDNRYATLSADLTGYVFMGSVQAVTKMYLPEWVSAPLSANQNMAHSSIMRATIIDSAPSLPWTSSAKSIFEKIGRQLGA